MYFIVPWDLWFYMRKFCITLTPFSYRKNLDRENLYYVFYRVALLWWHHWKHCHWWNAEWTQWLLAYSTCTTPHFHSSLTLKMKHDSLKAHPSASKNKTLTVGLTLLFVFNIGIQQHKRWFFFCESWLVCTCMHRYVRKWCTNSYSVDNENEKHSCSSG